VFYKQEHRSIGTNKVVVPEAFFKVVMCLNGDPKGIGFICKNENDNKKTSHYVNTIQQVERITGISFFPNLPDELAEKVKTKADINEW
jgi:endonuclease G